MTNAVLSACIIGVPDEMQVQRVKGFVVLKDKAQADPEMEKALIDHCQEHLIRWSWPREIEFRDNLPCTLVAGSPSTPWRRKRWRSSRPPGNAAGNDAEPDGFMTDGCPGGNDQ